MVIGNYLGQIKFHQKFYIYGSFTFAYDEPI